MLIALYRWYLNFIDHPCKLRILGWIEKIIFSPKGNLITTSNGYKVIVHPRDDVDKHVLEHGLYEPLTLSFVKNNLSKGGTSVCSGTAYGMHLIVSAEAVGEDGKVVGIDPQPSSLSGTLDNIEVNQLRGRIDLIASAIGNENGWLPISKPQNRNRGTFSFKARSDEEPDDYLVPIRKLDDLLSETGVPVPDLLLLDIEGSEEDVIESLSPSFKPNIIICELHPWMVDRGHTDPSNLFKLLTNLNYEIRDLYGNIIDEKNTIPEHNFVAHQKGYSIKWETQTD